MKLTKKQKAKWLKALRSGEYKQTVGTLYDEKTQGFCCLGVLQHCLSGGMVEVSDFDEYLASPSRKWYEDNGIALNENRCTDEEAKLVDMNDGLLGTKKRGFKFIANWIEKNVETSD